MKKKDRRKNASSLFDNAQTRNQSELSIDVLTFSFLSLLVFALLDHIARCIGFFALGAIQNMYYYTIIAFLLSTALLVFVIRYKVIILYKPRLDFLDILCLSVFLFYYLMKLPFPDTSHDALAAEIFLGEFAFTDTIISMKPFLPSTAAWFSLPDRVFYYFRFVLGYRLSTVINFIVICISYYKVKEVLAAFFVHIHENTYKKLGKHLCALILCLASFSALYKEYIVVGETITKGDLFVIPLFLECILLLSRKASNKTYPYAGLLIGLSIAIKLTNVAFFLPLIVYFLYKEYGGFKAINIAFAVIFCIIPILPYVSFSFLTTGNPVFPFYNNIFQSPYFPSINWKGATWGPKSIVETIFWPLYLSVNPTKTAELGFYSHSLSLGYISTFFCIMMKNKIADFKKLIPFFICLVSSILVWSATTGYGRYMLALEVFSFLLLTVFIYTLCCNYYDKITYLVFFTCVAALASLSMSTGYLVLTRTEWSWRPSFFSSRDSYIQAAKPNFPFILYDRKATNDPVMQSKLDSVQTWVCVDGLTGLATMANPNTDFIFLRHNSPSDPAGFIKNYFQSHSSDGLYAIRGLVDDNYYSLLDTYEFVIVHCEKTHLNFQNANNTFFFLQLMTKDQAVIDGISGLTVDEINQI